MDLKVIDYQSEYYQSLQNIWLETNMGGSERGDTEETIQKSLKIGGRLLLLVNMVDNTLIGSSWMTYDGRRIHLHHFAIKPYFQGKGYSKLLLDASLEHIKKEGVQVKIEVHSTNFKALNLYKSAGFKSLGDYGVYIIRDVEELVL